MTPRPRRAAVRQDDDLRAINEFADLVVATARRASHRDRRLAAAGVPITSAAVTALRLVERHGPIVASDVARRLELDQSTTSRQVRQLETEGLVTRTADADDGRVVWLAVTAAGRRVLDRVRDVTLNDFAVALSDWTARDRHTLATLLDRFRADLLATQVDETGWAVGKNEQGVASA